MIDKKFIRENTDLLKSKLSERQLDTSIIDKFINLDGMHLAMQQEAEALKEQRNKVSKEVAELKRKKEDTSLLISRMKEVSDKIKEMDVALDTFQKDIDLLLVDIPNKHFNDVPVGKSAEDNVEVKTAGKKKEFSFDPKDHLQLGKYNDILDFERGAKITGSGFPVYKGKGAALERALINYMLDTQTSNGYKEIIPPTLVNRASMEAAEKVPKFEEDMYHFEQDDLYAIPTAEVPLVNMHRDEILTADDLPIKYCAFTNCFRREAGSYGKETKGFLRVHQFNKVELVTFCKPEDSASQLDKMLNDACGILDKLQLHYRIIELCTGDLGFSSAKTYDIEVWSYAEDKWLEASSVSNFTDYQSRRAMIRFKGSEQKSKSEYVHILNGSGLATSRLMVGLLEHYQNEDGSINVPEVLRHYTRFDLI